MSTSSSTSSLRYILTSMRASLRGSGIRGLAWAFTAKGLQLTKLATAAA